MTTEKNFPIINLFFYILTASLLCAPDPACAGNIPAATKWGIVMQAVSSPDIFLPLLGEWEFTYRTDSPHTDMYRFHTVCTDQTNNYILHGNDADGNEATVLYEDVLFNKFMLFNMVTLDSFVFSLSGDTAKGSYYNLATDSGDFESLAVLTGTRKSKLEPDDTDGDGIGNTCDNCPETASLNQHDTDKDGLGNPCDTDIDGDGISNTEDNCIYRSNSDQADGDGDEVGNRCDNCPEDPDPGQKDTDGDGIGDACDETNDVSDTGDNNTICPAEMVFADSPETLHLLRSFRDKCLLRTASGRTMCKVYASFSPYAGSFMKNHPRLAFQVRSIMLTQLRILYILDPVKE